MLSLGINSDLGKVISDLDSAVRDQIPFAVSLALNRTAQLAIPALQSNMSVVFDRPKPYTLNSLFVKRASKTNLTATVYHSDKITPYLAPEIEGGLRGFKTFEDIIGVNQVLVPTSAIQRDAYGNVSKTMIGKILSAASVPNGEYFMVKPGDRSKLSPGVYMRTGRRTHIQGRKGNKTASVDPGKLICLMLFKPSAKYTPRYDMTGVVERVVQAEFDHQFASAMDYALATARTSGGAIKAATLPIT